MYPYASLTSAVDERGQHPRRVTVVNSIYVCLYRIINSKNSSTVNFEFYHFL